MHKDGQGVDERLGEGLVPAVTDSVGAAYEADDGPLSEDELAHLGRIARQQLPKSEVVSRRTLF